MIFVDHVPRAPNGKADYRRAKEHAEATADPLIPTREQMASSGRHLFTHSALTASVEQFFGEEVEDTFDAGVVALLGEHRVVALGAARAVPRR